MPNQPAPGGGDRQRRATSEPSVRVLMLGSDMLVVYESDDSPEGRRLVFESSSERRDLAAFPLSWRTMSDAELLRLRGA